MEEILTALLDISRLDTGAMKPQWSNFRIEELFRQLQREFEPIARERGLKLTFVTSSRTIAPTADSCAACSRISFPTPSNTRRPAGFSSARGGAAGVSS